MNADLPQIRVMGPDVTADDAREVGEAFVRALDAVAEAMGGPGGMFCVGDVRIACDALGCEATRPYDGDATGWWRSDDGRDFCPTHTNGATS